LFLLGLCSLQQLGDFRISGETVSVTNFIKNSLKFTLMVVSYYLTPTFLHLLIIIPIDFPRRKS